MIDYRWSKLTPNIFGLHPTIALFFPAWLVSFAFGSPMPSIVAAACLIYAVYLIVGARRQLGPAEFMNYLWCRFVLRFEWRVREW